MKQLTFDSALGCRIGVFSGENLQCMTELFLAETILSFRKSFASVVVNTAAETDRYNKFLF